MEVQLREGPLKGSDATPIVSARDLSKSYRSGEQVIEVLRKFSCELFPGDAVAVTGPSGSGKSTLLNIVSLIDCPDAGVVSIAGEQFDRASSESARAAVRRRSIGFVFQHFHLVSSLSVLQNAALPAQLNRMPDAYPRAEELLRRVGLAHRMSHLPGQLSGGEMQRCAIARALIHEPALIVADEPTGSLDARTRSSILDLLFEVVAGRRASSGHAPALLLATHSSEASNRAGRVIDLSS